jgi:predicted nucleic acid-binding Zn ribbon protein
MKKKEKKPEDIGGIIKQVISKLDTKTHGLRQVIIRTWQDAVEPKAMPHTRPMAIKKNILTIEVDSSTWLYFLSLNKRNILEKMNRALGKKRINDIKFRIGEIS